MATWNAGWIYLKNTDSQFSPEIMCDKKYAVTLENMNPHVKKLEYAVRGPIVIRATALDAELKAGAQKPFTEVVKCNIGDCHAVGQKPITFMRQVIALCTYTPLFDDPNIPADAKARAQRILDACGGKSLGAYSASTGVQVIRDDAAKFITNRDNLPSNPQNIFLTTGASDAIKMVLQTLSSGKDGKGRSGVMVPVPMYPLYSATLAEYNCFQMNYYLDESKSWGLTSEELERAYTATASECQPRAIVVINPGNPTGQVLAKEDLENVIRFAHRRNLLILADEVYQHNIYGANCRFISFKSALHSLGPEIAENVELASFMSTSKGYMGECGFRGGYCELTNMNPDVQAQLYKCLTAKLCCSVAGQAMMDTVVNPPQEGEPSYPLFDKERKQVLSDLKEKAAMVTHTLNSMPGITCNEVQGAMYAFPQLKLPQKAIDAAKANNQKPDAFYCFALLEECGVCVVPGSGFDQQPGTHHFRITILPPVEKIKTVMEKIRTFHMQFMEKYQ